MIDIAFIRENPDIIKQAAENKLMPVNVDRLLELDALLRELINKNRLFASFNILAICMSIISSEFMSLVEKSGEIAKLTTTSAFCKISKFLSVCQSLNAI